MKTLIRIGLATWLLASSLGYAQAQGGLAPDIGTGKKRAAVCFACHNADGISKIPGTPHLAGQERNYIENALRGYRDGQTRQNATMNAMAKSLSDRDIVNIAAYFSLQTRMNNGQTAAQTLETIDRIRPVANSQVTATSVSSQITANNTVGASTIRSGDAVYGSVCVACHGTGAAGAPKFGDKAAWLSRVTRGLPVLQQHAIAGFNAMPARGGCVECSDAELKSAVEYILAHSK